MTKYIIGDKLLFKKKSGVFYKIYINDRILLPLIE